MCEVGVTGGRRGRRDKVVMTRGRLIKCGFDAFVYTLQVRRTREAQGKSCFGHVVRARLFREGEKSRGSRGREGMPRGGWTGLVRTKLVLELPYLSHGTTVESSVLMLTEGGQ